MSTPYIAPLCFNFLLPVIECLFFFCFVVSIFKRRKSSPLGKPIGCDISTSCRYIFHFGVPSCIDYMVAAVETTAFPTFGIFLSCSTVILCVHSKMPFFVTYESFFNSFRRQRCLRHCILWTATLVILVSTPRRMPR